MAGCDVGLASVTLEISLERYSSELALGCRQV